MADDPRDDPARDASDERSQAAWAARQAALGARLDGHRKARELEDLRGTTGGMRGAADGLRLASEFVAGILAGAGIGYLLDRLAGTSPFGLIVFLIFGFVAGVLNVLRSVGKTPAPAPPAQKLAAKHENTPLD